MTSILLPWVLKPNSDFGEAAKLYILGGVWQQFLRAINPTFQKSPHKKQLFFMIFQSVKTAKNIKKCNKMPQGGEDIPVQKHTRPEHYPHPVNPN